MLSKLIKDGVSLLAVRVQFILPFFGEITGYICLKKPTAHLLETEKLFATCLKHTSLVGRVFRVAALYLPTCYAMLPKSNSQFIQGSGKVLNLLKTEESHTRDFPEHLQYYAIWSIPLFSVYYRDMTSPGSKRAISMYKRIIGGGSTLPSAELAGKWLGRYVIAPTEKARGD
ncbi:hypothetical protein CONCODRAFT_3817 [Conidiobolus coronatus NRRL 28638]|uniref:Uncharacterized protein n=1 Tax=Conidiobolus coronatus (strain ATCC 28846 / CBS 209.66 / NRRL 28638) TaxID=796925 RepID=A0A137PDS2_CONC2|nr:hypothetical protein CONCODRAFT_3817 [Conidiobolus coronatus NRRL 28638]|eukprot:KXN73153.1 hypothetical protein CONCODRAFT_3817 [Conidiobolus coronatus NRRL 28638]